MTPLVYFLSTAAFFLLKESISQFSFRQRTYLNNQPCDQAISGIVEHSSSNKVDSSERHGTKSYRRGIVQTECFPAVKRVRLASINFLFTFQPIAVESSVYLPFTVQFCWTRSLCKVLNKYEENFKDERPSIVIAISPANFTRNHRHRTYTKLFEILILFKRNQL